MDIASLMTRQPVTVSMDDTVATVRDLLEAYVFHHLLVVEGEFLVGVISDRDVLAALSPFVGRRDERAADERLLHRKAHQIMSRNPVCVVEGTPLIEAAGLLLANRISCLPVVDAQGRPVGIVTWRDLLTWSLDRMADRRAA